MSKVLIALGKLLIFVGVIVLYILNLSFFLNSSVSTIVAMLTLGIGLMLFWMYVRIAEERNQKEQAKQDSSQSDLA